MRWTSAPCYRKINGWQITPPLGQGKERQCGLSKLSHILTQLLFSCSLTSTIIPPYLSVPTGKPSCKEEFFAHWLIWDQAYAFAILSWLGNVTLMGSHTCCCISLWVTTPLVQACINKANLLVFRIRVSWSSQCQSGCKWAFPLFCIHSEMNTSSLSHPLAVLRLLTDFKGLNTRATLNQKEDNFVFITSGKDPYSPIVLWQKEKIESAPEKAVL